MNNTKYRDYFKIDEDYYPCVNESAINDGLRWDEFYPHATFIDLLKKTERMLSRSERRSIWITGAYGTGKSYAAYALSKLLTSNTSDVEKYFDKYESLKDQKTDLMQKIIAQKNEGKIISCYKYASSNISATSDLVAAMQELISRAVESENLSYKGGKTLCKAILEWLTDERNYALFKGYAEKEYKALFGGYSAEDIVNLLKTSEDCSSLVSKISEMANKIGITALKFDVDRLKEYIKDLINGNNLKALVFVLDEFSEFFKNNIGRLTDFQKLVELCNEVPFYLIVVAHEMTSYFHEKDVDAKKIKDRFMPCVISMPDNIAFDLMNDALKIKDEAKDDWAKKVDDLQAFTTKSRREVGQSTGIKESVLYGILPLHPMAALLLKHISTAFESNQRSMFDFIKNEGNYKAFQWYIDNHGPYDEKTCLLTVDMLWDFFYETGKDNLALSIRNILDVYKKAEQQKLLTEEQQILKTILIMQAVSAHLNDSISLFITNEANLRLAFEGTAYEIKAPEIADKLVREEVIYKKNLGGNKFCYAAIVAAGDEAERDKRKKEKKDKLRTQDLLIEDMTRVFSLSQQLRLRYEIEYVTCDDITAKTNRIANDSKAGEFVAIIAVAKNDNEAVQLRKLIREKAKVADIFNKNIVFVDTTSTPFGENAIEEYVDYIASAEMLRGNDNAQADDMLRKGKMVAGKWGNRIFSNNSVVYSKLDSSGKTCSGWHQVQALFKDIVENKYSYTFDYCQGLTEATFQRGAKPQWIEAGIQAKSGGLTAAVEKLISNARAQKRYWETDRNSSIAQIKIKLDGLIEGELERNSKISLLDICYFLLNDYGFIPSNLYSFLTGFLLKEYATDLYHISDDANNDKLSPELLKVNLAETIKQLYEPSNRYRTKYIRVMSQGEQLFCELMQTAFDIPEGQCNSVEDAIKRVRIKERSKGLPAWVLSEKTTGAEVDFLNNFLKILNPNQETNVSAVCNNIGSQVENDPNFALIVKKLMADENRIDAMKSFIKIFDDGILYELTNRICAYNNVISDIKAKFNSENEGLWLWSKETGENEIRKVVQDYYFVEKTNQLLFKTNSTFSDAHNSWKDKLKFVKISHELLNEDAKYCAIASALFEVLNSSDRDACIKLYHIILTNEEDIRAFLQSSILVFTRVCASQLQGLSEKEIKDIYDKLNPNSMRMDKHSYVKEVENIVNDYRCSLEKIKLITLWKNNTDTVNPFEWEALNLTPIMSCVPEKEWNEYKRIFATINAKNPDESEVTFSFEYLLGSSIWDTLNNKDKIEDAFVACVIKEYKNILTSVNEVKECIVNNTHIAPSDWTSNSHVAEIVKQLAQAKYAQTTYASVSSKIDEMSEKDIRACLKRLIKDNMLVGIEILESNRGE